MIEPDEFDRDPEFISMDAPLARALLGKPVDAEIRLETPEGPRHYVIVEVAYTTPAD